MACSRVYQANSPLPGTLSVKCTGYPCTRYTLYDLRPLRLSPFQVLYQLSVQDTHVPRVNPYFLPSYLFFVFELLYSTVQVQATTTGSTWYRWFLRLRILTSRRKKIGRGKIPVDHGDEILYYKGFALTPARRNRMQ